jgi:hypothetical protein
MSRGGWGGRQSKTYTNEEQNISLKISAFFAKLRLLRNEPKYYEN